MDPRDRMIAVPELRLHVREWSTGGRAIILVHGLASNAHVWDAVAPKLGDRFRVIGIDQRGHGQSDKPDDGYDFPTVAGDLRALVTSLGIDRPALVGHSWGGNVALHYAATYPDEVAALVLVDGGFIDLASDPAMTWERAARELRPPDLMALTFDELTLRVRDGGADAYWSDAVLATLRGSFSDGPDGRLRPRLSLENHLKILRALWEQRPADLYRRVRCPTLIVPARRPGLVGWHAELQVARAEQVARAAAAIPRAQVLWMEESVHDVPLQRPAELAAAIERLLDGG